jgi:hypothetical protein
MRLGVAGNTGARDGYHGVPGQYAGRVDVLSAVNPVALV